jgi:putative transposase
MPRTARLDAPGGVFHLVSRFVRDEPLLDEEGARDAYLELLGAAATKADVTVLAYCLMSTHVHLVAVQGQITLERFTKSVHTGFAKWVNGRRGKKAQGPVFAGRPRTLLVDEDTYLLQLVRYVHNNPVRARVSRSARTSAWSSHRAYVGRDEAPEWLRVGYVLGRFDADPKKAAARFDEFVDEGRAEPRRPELSGALDASEAAAVRRALGDGHRITDGVLGDEAFADKVRSDATRVEAALSRRGSERRAGALGRPTVRQVIDAVLLHRGVEPIELDEHPRGRRASAVKKLAIWVWVHEYAGQQIDIARALGLDTSVVSRHYGAALADAAAYDEAATAITARLAAKKRPRPAKATRADADGVKVRYHVDVSET